MLYRIAKNFFCQFLSCVVFNRITKLERQEGYFFFFLLYGVNTFLKINNKKEKESVSVKEKCRADQEKKWRLEDGQRCLPRAKRQCVRELQVKIPCNHYVFG